MNINYLSHLHTSTYTHIEHMFVKYDINTYISQSNSWQLNDKMKKINLLSDAFCSEKELLQIVLLMESILI